MQIAIENVFRFTQRVITYGTSDRLTLWGLLSQFIQEATG